MAHCYVATADAPAAVQVQYIEGLQMDWAINDGLYNWFKMWKIWCDFILRAELEALSEAHKSKTLLHWSGDKGLELYQSCGIDNDDLTLQTIWDKFEEHCKPQASELHAWYDLLKQFKQGNKCCDEYYALLQNPLALCQYLPETLNILERDVFLFGITDQQFMSKCITEETSLTTAVICQWLKKLESSRVTAEHITGGPSQGAINQVHGKQPYHGKRGKGGGNNHGNQNGGRSTNQQQQQKQLQHSKQEGNQKLLLKHQHNDHMQKGQYKKPKLDPTICMQCGDTRHSTNFKCPTTHFDCKKCHKTGHFTHCSLSKSAKVNEINCNFGTDPAVNAFDVSSDDTFYVCNVKVSRKPGKQRIYAILKIDGTDNYLWACTDTAADVNLMPTTVCTQIFKDPKMEFTGPMDINLPMYNDSAVQTLGACVSLLVSPIDGHKHDTKFYVAQHRGSILFSCEDLLYLQLIQWHPVLSKHTPHGANIISSKHDLAYINFVTRNKQVSHYQPEQSSVPSQTITHIPAANGQVHHTLEEVKKKYSDVFDGLGKFPGEPYHINLDPEVPQKWVPWRPVPVHHTRGIQETADQDTASWGPSTCQTIHPMDLKLCECWVWVNQRWKEILYLSGPKQSQ